MRIHIAPCLAVLVLCLVSLVYSESKEDFYKNLQKVPFAQSERDVQQRSCPNGCSGHGSCRNGVCYCSPGFRGVDCSIEVKSLTLNTPLRNEQVGYRDWMYYSAQVSPQQSLAFEVNSSNGDCDLFVKYASLPTLHAYDQRDISVSPNSRINVNVSKGSGTYNLGVFGFSSCSYAVEAIVLVDCPNACSGHGECNRATATCTCQDGYAGDDCSVPVETLTKFVPRSSFLATNFWKYYRYVHQGENNAIGFIVNQTSQRGDADLYINLGSIPNLTDWRFRENGVNGNFSLIIDQPASGIWYAGVYAFSAVSYKITALPIADCPNDCSGNSHGVCGMRVGCSCRPGYVGSYCQTKLSPLLDNQVISGIVADAKWNYYTYYARTTNDVVVSVNQTQDTAHPDCDVYVRAESQPSLTEYDYRSISIEDNIKLVLEDGLYTYWHIGIFGYSACSYLISVYPSVQCIAGCETHGTCLSNGECRCDPNYAGEDCSLPVTHISSGVRVPGTIDLHSNNSTRWRYYELMNVNTSYISVHLKETDVVGSLWLFIRAREYPTLQIFDKSDQETGSAYHVLELETDLPPGAKMDYYIGVYANAFTVPQSSVAYQLEAWVPPF